MHDCEYCRTGIIPQEWKDNAKELNKHFSPIVLPKDANLQVTWSMAFDEDMDLVSMGRKVEMIES